MPYKVYLIGLLLVSLVACTQSVSKKSNFAEKPKARWGHVFEYNPDENQILLFGGTNTRGGTYLADTWTWQYEKWTHVDTPGPMARGFSASAYHDKRGTIIIHGGRGNERVTYSDLWEWDGTTWTQLEESSAYKADHHQMVYLKNENTLLAFGGWNGKEVIGETWQWKDHWNQLDVPSPPKRSAFGMAYNKKTKKATLYGGLWINGQYADLWEWSNDQWHSVSGPYDHSSLDHHSMIYDNNLEKIIGFGGKNYRYVAQRNTFTIEKNQIEVIAKEGPSNRHSFGFTFDSNAHFGYLYGGKEYKDGEQVALSDFWKWDGENWNEIPNVSNEIQ